MHLRDRGSVRTLRPLFVYANAAYRIRKYRPNDSSVVKLVGITFAGPKIVIQMFIGVFFVVESSTITCRTR